MEGTPSFRIETNPLLQNEIPCHRLNTYTCVRTRGPFPVWRQHGHPGVFFQVLFLIRQIIGKECNYN